jgi:hypothetical protein
MATTTEKNQRLSRACIIHLVIKRTNWPYVKTISCSGSHLGIPINIKNTNFESRHPNDDLDQPWLKSAKWFQRRRFLK